MKNRIYSFLSKPYIVIIVMIIAPILSIADRNFGYFFGLFVALFLLWGSNWNWAKFGIWQKVNLRTILRGLLLSIAIFVIIDICIQPFLEIYYGNIDLSSVDEIRGDFASFFIPVVRIRPIFGWLPAPTPNGCSSSNTQSKM